MARKNFEAEAKKAAAGDTDETHAKLLAALKAEEMQAVGYETSAEVTQHTEALNRYFGKPYGDEVDGRSKLTTREIYETVAWTVPDLLDIFAAGGRICDLEADDPQAEAQIDQRADYLDYVFFKDNQGVLILHDFIFDALMHPRAYADVDWDDNPSYSGWEEYENVSEMEAGALLSDPGTEIDPDSIEEKQDETGQPLYSLKARKRLKDGCCKIDVAPPEDVFVAGRAVSMPEARYKGRLLRWRRSVWKQNFPEKRQEIEDYSASDESVAIDTDERRQARFDDGQASHGEFAAAANKAAEELVGRKEYIWYADPDTDADAKLYRVYRLGDVILEVEEVDDDPFASASSHRVPHRLQGLSIPEILGDLQRLKTVLTRALVDGTMQANVPRVGADKNKVNLDDLLNLDYGAVVRTDGAPGDALFPILTPDLSASTLKALEWSNQIIEQRTGVTRHAQGMDPDSLNHTAKGIQLIQNAANAVKRLLARLIAVGVEEMMTKVDRTIMRHQKSPREVKLGKQWVRVDPRSWSPAMRVTVTVGLGTGAKDAQLQLMQMIQQDQMLAYQTFGPDNPVVTLKHLHATVTEKVRIMGYQSADKFFGDPVGQDGKEWKPQPQPSPEMQKVNAQIKEGQAKLQMQGQEAMQNAQIKQFEVKAQTEAAAQKAALDAQVSEMEMNGRLRILEMESARKMEIAMFEAQQKALLAREQFEFEKQMQTLETNAKVEAIQATAKAKASGKANGSAANGAAMSTTKFGGEPG